MNFVLHTSPSYATAFDPDTQVLNVNNSIRISGAYILPPLRRETRSPITDACWLQHQQLGNVLGDSS
ncbi:hypothetical protein T02_14935 [Trichinella nativa]|uniref:Uncharacterized protein n=1 Tax=Trichinella nativa TaxID=6335 RepID=A0A0V1KP17_9BILA|nr:hypothetical protein T02_14935 [Trichinella nativa]